jgi:poly(3-hydroxybutyrate) depolymerase
VARPLTMILLVLLACPALCGARQEYEVTIPTTLADTTETFWLQIPTLYSPATPVPLLVGWHQLGGDRLEMRNASDFDLEADLRTWIAVSMDGPSPTHWTNHAAQSHMVDVIRWVEAHYAVDPDRIYMVGASMGGAAGMVFANNHLDPAGPMVAAAASISGIQDCERRFHEQGYNYSMAAAFGGTPEEVPFVFHRNSAVVFGDSTKSMHVNARHVPLYLTFGRGVTDSIWRAHAEDLYDVMAPIADSVVLRESSQAGHGWGCAEEGRVCAFLGAAMLDRSPGRISIRADEEGRWYWADLAMRDSSEAFARIDATVDVAAAHVEVGFLANVLTATLDLAPLGFPLGGRFDCRWKVEDAGIAALEFLDVPSAPVRVLRDGGPFSGWSYDSMSQLLRMEASGVGLYTILFEPASATDADGASVLRIWQANARTMRYAPACALDWRLYDIVGRLIDSGAASSGTIPIATRVPSGSYALRLMPRAQATRPITRSVLILR